MLASFCSFFTISNQNIFFTSIIMYVYPIATVFNNAKQHINVYGDDIEVDYRGYEVIVACKNTGSIVYFELKHYNYMFVGYS